MVGCWREDGGRVGEVWGARPGPDEGPLALFALPLLLLLLFAPALLDARRRFRERSGCVTASSASCSSSSSFPPEMLRPPGTLAGPDGAAPTCGGMGMAAARPRGWPTGMDDGRVPCGAFRQAWMRFLPSG